MPSVKIADGVIATSELPTAASSNASYANDAFQRIIKDAQTANIMFLIQQANLRNSELNSDDIKEFHKKVACLLYTSCPSKTFPVTAVIFSSGSKAVKKVATRSWKPLKTAVRPAP